MGAWCDGIPGDTRKHYCVRRLSAVRRLDRDSMWGASVRALQSTTAGAKSKKAMPAESEDAELLTRDAASRVRGTELESTVWDSMFPDTASCPLCLRRVGLAATLSKSTEC